MNSAPVMAVHSRAKTPDVKQHATQAAVPL
jgi:hypothetical protein